MKSLHLLALALITNVTAAEFSAKDWHFSGSLENTLWSSDGIPAGFLEFDDSVFSAPRLSVNFDYQPDPRFYFHTTIRADRGFDPGTEPDGELRIDRLLLRYRPFGDNTLNIQAGKSATVIGNWVPNHGYYDDPFLLAPLPYSAIVGISTNSPDGHSPQAIENRANSTIPTLHLTKQSWSSIVWGPSYTNGFSVFGNKDKFNYAFEIKNAFLGSAPSQWDLGFDDLDEPTFSGRVGYQANAALTVGLSASQGSYLNADTLANFDRNDFKQTLIAADLRWAHRNWIVSAEAFFATYDSLDEDLQSFSYYLQARYKVAPGVWLAGRFGQTLSNEVSVPSGGTAPWSPDLLRAEIALGWRITPELLLKTQYTYTEVTNDLSAPAPNLFGFSLGWRF